MATQVGSIQHGWPHILSQDSTAAENDTKLYKNQSFLYSGRLQHTVEQSKRVFLNLAQENVADNQIRKGPSKKISFKVKKTSSFYRRSHAQQKMSNLSATSVAQLTSKFNQIAQNKLEAVKEKPTEKSSENDSGDCVDRKSSVGSVKAAIEIFEKRLSTPTNKLSVPKPKVPDKNFTVYPKEIKFRNSSVTLTVFEKTDPVDTKVERKSDSLYGNLNLIRTVPPAQILKTTRSAETISPSLQPNSSFLWRGNSGDKADSWQETYDVVQTPATLPRPVSLNVPMNTTMEDKPIYEELNLQESSKELEVQEDGYEYCSTSPIATDNIYETLPNLPARRKEEPLPSPPISRNSSCAMQNGDIISNCYETIERESETISNNYESIYNCRGKQTQEFCSGDSNRDSLVSSDQQSNSLYGRSLVGVVDDMDSCSIPSSDASENWEDLSENENDRCEKYTTKERHKTKKHSSWSKVARGQRNKKTGMAEENNSGTGSDTDHHYESLYTNHEEVHEDDTDSFESDTESEKSFNKGTNLNDSGVDIDNMKLPDPPTSQTYVFTRLAASAGKHMKKLKTNWSATKNDFTKSLSRMTKRKSRTDVRFEENGDLPSYQNVQFSSQMENRNNTSKGLLEKIRRSISLSPESANEVTQNLTKPKSTFYLTDVIDVDNTTKEDLSSGHDSGFASSPTVNRTSTSNITRPHSPPPPIPVSNTEPKKGEKKEKRSASWYTEVGLFKNQEKRSSTCWYAEVGLYPSHTSTPSTSSAENSGTNLMPSPVVDVTDDTLTIQDRLIEEMQLRLQDEPLYQFYDAAISESVYEGSDDSDGYEEVGHTDEESLSSRPSAMDLVVPQRNSLVVNRTLWCEVPEVINSSILSTLSTVQMKLQEAKFEMITSEASYLNSLNVLMEHFITNIRNSGLINSEDCDTLFGKIKPVKECSESLLCDLERCWQDNILLHGICDIIQRHAENDFQVYVTYCENQVLLDSALKKHKEKPEFNELLRQLENSSACQSLTLYSFLMLPMQRITRWPLLIDAVLKRLSPQDEEHVSCKYTLATMNKIVHQCNEAARKTEREREMQVISSQIEFAKGVTPIPMIAESRWLVRSGCLTQMTPRGDENILTFGKRFAKVPYFLFLFNDLLLVTKQKGEQTYLVQHYCARNLVELTSTDSIVSFPVKDSQNRNLIFMTILENQDQKTVEFLFSCNSESDKERWVEALTPRKSEDPDETIYECWDCPQVTALHNYIATQPDELNLNKGDVINVTRKMADGWYHGERIRDGQIGWFPANYTKEIANPHVRARNLKQRYRLLAFSENYLKSK